MHVRLGQPGARITDRLQQVLKSSNAAKEEVRALSVEALMDFGVMFFALMEFLNRSKLDRLLAPSYNLIVSNVPGPGAERMYLGGSLLEASYPISTLLPGVNLNATLLSHGNRLDFGLMGDMHSLPDLHIVARGMEARLRGTGGQGAWVAPHPAGVPPARWAPRKPVRPKYRSRPKAGNGAHPDAGQRRRAGVRTDTTDRRVKGAPTSPSGALPRCGPATGSSYPPFQCGNQTSPRTAGRQYRKDGR